MLRVLGFGLRLLSVVLNSGLPRAPHPVFKYVFGSRTAEVVAYLDFAVSEMEAIQLFFGFAVSRFHFARMPPKC